MRDYAYSFSINGFYLNILRKAAGALKPRQCPLDFPAEQLNFKCIFDSWRNINTNIMESLESIFKGSTIPLIGTGGYD